MPTSKIDLIKLHKGEYSRRKTPGLIQTSPARYLSIAGRGPLESAFGECVGHLYNMAYTIKMASKAEGLDYRVCPLEARYWGPDEGANRRDPYAFVEGGSADQSAWRWQAMIRTPVEIGESHLEAGLASLLAKGKPDALRGIELVDLEEGMCAQVLHEGAYEESMRSVDQLLGLAEAEGWKPAGRHHEIYLSDPRRVESAKLKTILRLPLQR